MPVKSSIGEIRKRSHLTQADMAIGARISRQAYSAIETGRAVPSTEVALRLALVLKATVEELFSLDDRTEVTLTADLAGDEVKMPAGSPVQLVQVGNRLLARSLSHEATMNHTFNPADGLVKSVRGGEADITVLDESCLGVPTIVLAGCDPATSILSHMLSDMGIRLVWIEQESMPALHSLARGEVHVAGCNFKDPASGTYNLPLVKEIVPFPCTVIRFAVWRHGLIVRAGNPKRISKVSDLVRPDIALINRWPGAGSRGLLNRLLKEAKIPVELVRGYDKAVNGHLAAAETVASGLVDCGVGIEAAARANGLDFTPLSEEPYDLVIPNVFLNSPAIQRLIELLRLNKLRRQIDLLRGYDTSSMGLTFS